MDTGIIARCSANPAKPGTGPDVQGKFGTVTSAKRSEPYTKRKPAANVNSMTKAYLGGTKVEFMNAATAGGST